jgi:hypothetical protein
MSLTFGVGLVDPLEKLRALFSLSRAMEHVLHQSTFHALRHLFDSLHATVDQAVQSQTLAEFQRRRQEGLRSYVNLLQAISLVAQNEIKEEDFPLMARDSLNHLHDEFVALDIDHLGADAAEQVSFCIFTIKRIFRVLPKMIAPPNSGSDIQRDRELNGMFAEYLLLSHFHLDCVRAILKRRVQVNAQVLGAVLEGLQTGALAYETLRQAMELRATPELELSEDITWDDEDEALLDESENAGSPLA